MEVNQVKLIYFSPTGTTKKVLDSIAEGIAVKDFEHINLTLPEGAQQTIQPFVMEDEMWKNITNWLNENCSNRKEPQILW